jgi:hypothetical protein
MHAVDLLWKRLCWGRLWVIQELVLAMNAVLICGKKRLSYDTFQNASYFLERCGINLRLQNTLSRNLSILKADSDREDRKCLFDLACMLYRTRPNKATEPPRQDLQTSGNCE